MSKPEASVPPWATPIPLTKEQWNELVGFLENNYDWDDHLFKKVYPNLTKLVLTIRERRKQDGAEVRTRRGPILPELNTT